MEIRDTFSESRGLIKEASQYKYSNLNKAISLINEAINICPEHVLSDYIKLSSYYHLALNKIKAYEILENQLFYVNENNILLTLHLTLSSIYEYIGVLLFKDKLYQEYIYNFSLQRFYVVLAFYSQGRVDHLEQTNAAFDMLGLSYFQKINKCFFEINKSGNTAPYSLAFTNLFDTCKVDLIKLNDNCNKYKFSSKLDFEWPKGKNAIVSINAEKYWPSEIIVIIKKYNDTYFKEYFEKNLKEFLT